MYLHAYTLVIVLTAFATGPGYMGSKPRFLLPAMSSASRWPASSPRRERGW